MLTFVLHLHCDSRDCLQAQILLGGIITVTHLDSNHDVHLQGLVWWRFVVLLAFGVCAGANVGTWVESALGDIGVCDTAGFDWVPDQDWMFSWLTKNDKGIPADQCGALLVWQSLMLTASLYFCFFVAALFAKAKTSLFWMASWITVGLWIMSFTLLFGRLEWISIEQFDLVYLRFGLVLYAFKTSMDTQMIIYKFEKQNDQDVVSHALTMLLSILHMFIRIVKILAIDAKKKKKK